MHDVREQLDDERATKNGVETVATVAPPKPTDYQARQLVLTTKYVFWTAGGTIQRIER